MDTPPDSQRKAWARLSTLTSFVSRICFFKARCSDSDSVNGFIVIPPAFDFTRVRLGGVKKILSTYLHGRVCRYWGQLLRLFLPMGWSQPCPGHAFHRALCHRDYATLRLCPGSLCRERVRAYK